MKTLPEIIDQIKEKINNPHYLMNSVEFGKSGAYITISLSDAKLLVSDVARLQTDPDELKRLNDK